MIEAEGTSIVNSRVLEASGDIPLSETADRHATYYVNRKLPEHIREGTVLTHGDVARMKELLDCRDGHIERLYTENTELRKAQDSGLGGHFLYLAKRAYVRFRR